jgi:uncharacterized membrane protein
MSMGHVRLSEHINAPIDHVWEIAASCERLPEWNTSIIEVKDCPDRLDLVGARVTVLGRLLGRRIEGTQETTRADKPHALAIKISGAGGLTATSDISLAESGGGTDATIDVEYELPMGIFVGIAERLLGGAVERDVRHSNENFKALCEATVPARV